MADSNATKRAFAEALKELWEENAFDKISVGDICEKCNRNRNSFYYHFKDEYDLVNWIFDTEFMEVAIQKTYNQSWDFLMDISSFFEENRSFYRKALCIKGQNSFYDHFREVTLKIITNYLYGILDGKEMPEFQINFFADALVMTFQRWILEYEGMKAPEFVEQLKRCVQYLVDEYDKMR